MANILKAILWIIVLSLVVFLVLGKTRNKAEAPVPTPEQTGGVGGDRAEVIQDDSVEDNGGVLFDADLDFSSSM
jgi:hypothetical protein